MIVALSGRKHSGKNQCADWIHEWAFKKRIPVRFFSFADSLKRTTIEILGIPEEWVYGSNSDKDREVPHLLWENFPLNIANRKVGPMTVREVLQYWGTNIFRKAWVNTWAYTCINKIKEWESVPVGAVHINKLSIITDLRFPNEVDAVKSVNGTIVRLTRSPFNDQHYSETALDPNNFDWGNFDIIVDNKNQTIEQTKTSIIEIMQGLIQN